MGAAIDHASVGQGADRRAIDVETVIITVYGGALKIGQSPDENRHHGTGIDGIAAQYSALNIKPVASGINPPGIDQGIYCGAAYNDACGIANDGAG
ncbi:hypothetical protein [Nitrospirillum amazonense]|uniref:hypothetical protein n=1 Tax=Nitrospirillum amazonense TaxID=28077 RepID=UPI001648C6E8|nr:hypothetical protein [Nitrospirillum amazonense]MDG3442194.1 hypothetical protein [Nitrospirillum amazonense]